MLPSHDSVEYTYLYGMHIPLKESGRIPGARFPPTACCYHTRLRIRREAQEMQAKGWGG